MLKEAVGNIRKRFSNLFAEDVDELDIPSEDKPEKVIVEFVQELYDDSITWREKSLESRFADYDDPVDLWKDARKLANGKHWDVWGHRNDPSRQTWMHEITRPVIEQQIGVRKTYLTSNVHDVVLFPNVANLNEIVRQERDNTDWSKFIVEIVGRALVDGTAVGKEILDRSEFTDGLSRSIVCDPESLLPTPYSTSLNATDGCFSGETEFFANGKLVCFSDVVGDSVKVLARDGIWRNANVRSFGVQKLNKIILVPYGLRSNFKLEYTATGNHKWFTTNRGETDSLSVGDRILVSPTSANKDSQEYKDGFVHGVIFGDGSVHYETKNGYRHKIHLYGKKQRYIDLLKSHDGYVFTKDDTSSQYRYDVDEKIVYLNSCFNMKLLPSENMGLDYNAGFLDGWVAMDGSLRTDGRGGNRLSSTNKDAIDWLIKIAPLLGYCITGIMVDPTIETNYGKRTSLVQIVTLTNKPIEYVVKDISDTGRCEEVYCVVEPETHSFTLSGGVVTSNCWYLVDATLQNLHQLKQDFPDFDASGVEDISKDKIDKISMKDDVDSFERTKMVLVLTVNLDDSKMEKVPFDEDEFNRRTALIQEGQQVPVEDRDLHAEYIRRYIDWLENVVLPNVGETEEDVQFAEKISEYTQMIIEEHGQKMIEFPNDKRSKYPYGRRIIIAGDKLIEDKPNPLGYPWRKQYYKLDCEIVPGSFWGRGLPEQMWHINQTLDTFLSRAGDLSLLSIPEKWLHLEDIEELRKRKAEYNNDPLELKAYVGTAPISIQSQVPTSFYEMVNQMLDASEKRLGVNDVLSGQSPGSHASGDLVQILLSQSMNMVTGEMARNLNEFVNSVMETKVYMYRNFYTEERLWIINGRQEILNLAQELEKYPVFQIRVKPNSNFPNQWENDLALLLKMSQPLPDGTILVPPEFIQYIIGQRYPELAPGGKYYQMSKATQIGMQVMAQEQEKQQKNAQALQQAEARMTAKGLDIAMGQQPIGETNGTT
jgi:hypothetical protein